MSQKIKRQNIGGFIFGFILLVIISLIILIWGISTYDGAEMPEETEITETEELDQEDEQIEDSSETEKNEENKTDLEDTENDTENDTESDTEKYSIGRRMYKQLNEEEKKVYEVLQQTLANGELECKVENIKCSINEISDLASRSLYAVYFDYPEYFWMNGGYSIKTHIKHDSITLKYKVATYDYWQYVLNKKEYIDAVNSKAAEIAEEAKKLETTYERVKYVHDYLVKNAVYDYVALEEINKSVQKASSQKSHTVYGCLVDQLSVCDGYAKSFQMIMNLLGIEAEFVIGDAGGPHAWNYIHLDGEDYWMDVTWDDANLRDESGNLMYPHGVEYAYFCITSDDLEVTHTPSTDYFIIPECDSTEYNFFYKEDSYLDTYEFESFSRVFENQKNEQIVSVKFASNNEMNKAVEELIGQYKYYEIPELEDSNFRYVADERHSILSIFNE